MAKGVQIRNLEVKAGQVISVSLSGGCYELVQMAIGEVKIAQENITHMQRPLERKFNSIVSKLEALLNDIKKHEEYVEELETRKLNRHSNTLMRQFVNQCNGKQLDGVFGVLQENWSQDPTIMQGR